MLKKILNFSSMSCFAMEPNSSLPNPATIDLALALPTLSVVLGSLRGGAGAGDLPPPPAALRGSVAYWRAACTWGWDSCATERLLGTPPPPPAFTEMTVMETREPELRIRSTTCSCEADDTSSPLIWKWKTHYKLSCKLFFFSSPQLNNPDVTIMISNYNVKRFYACHALVDCNLLITHLCFTN